jgi:hypothetical protein
VVVVALVLGFGYLVVKARRRNKRLRLADEEA